jgi:UDP-galactopyranose mutase
LKKKILIIGTGFSGSIIAHELSTKIPHPPDITLIEQRTHIGGNCYTKRDLSTGVMVHEYGPHIFHTSNLFIWNYINSFVPFRPFINRVKSVYKGNIYSLPINLHTINQFFGKILNPNSAKSFIHSLSDKSIIDPLNFEEQALKYIGKELYQAFFLGYTKKQWGTDPKNLPASILKRLPIRFSYDDNYYNDTYQGIPENGYTEIFEKMLDHKNISVICNQKFIMDKSLERDFDHIFYTGPIDEFFNYKFGRLSYRTVTFERYIENGDFQGNAVINYGDEEIPYTRIHEHKHFSYWENHDKTIYFKEFSKETDINDIPFYPKRLENDLKLLDEYNRLTAQESNVTFLGRLATYKYMDMHHIIEESLSISQKFLNFFK